jgi:hypothetical protein
LYGIRVYYFRQILVNFSNVSYYVESSFRILSVGDQGVNND